jgi:hypothetical protein
MVKASRRSRGKTSGRLESFAEATKIIPVIASGFLKKKKARALEEQLEIAHFLLRLSFLVKENVFDRPEVKEFFSKSALQVSVVAQKALSLVVPKERRLHASSVSRR